MGHISFWLMLMWEITDTLKESTDFVIDASNKVGLEIHLEKTKYMLLIHRENTGPNCDVKIANIL
jgi:hypothetical protein